MYFALTVFVLLAGAVVVGARRHGRSGLRFALFLVALCIGIAGCTRPLVEHWHALVIALSAAVLVVTLAVRPPSRDAPTRGLSAVGLVVAFGLIIPLGVAELVCVFAWKQGWIRVFEPTHLEVGPGLSAMAAFVHTPGTEDWRLSHIVGDELRELDPVLFWRTVPKPPYNAQGFKGDIAAVPKPPDVFRVMAFGDSNTDGPPGEVSWPACLQSAIRARADLAGKRCEVLNAGVAGYSSYQGLLRARRDVATYTPDLILVSFGWNDLPAAVGRSDKEFRPPSWLWVRAIEELARSKLFLYFKQLADDPSPAPVVGPRVSLDDYADNLQGFLDLARERGIGVAFLSRPHQLTEVEQRKLPGWRGHVPDYNDAVRAFAARTGAPFVEIERPFEGRDDHFYDDAHFAMKGHRAMSILLRDRLDELGLLSALHTR